MPFQNMANHRVSVLRCKRCFHPHEKGNKPRFLPWQLSLYVLNEFSELTPLFYLTTDNVDIELDFQRAKPLKIKAHRFNRGPGGTLNVQFETVWRGHETSTWEHESSMAQYDGDIVRKYWCSDEIHQVGADNRRYRTYQRLAALCADARPHGSGVCHEGYESAGIIRNGPKLLTKDMKDSRICFKMATEGWQLGIIQDVDTGSNARLPYTVNCLD